MKSFAVFFHHTLLLSVLFFGFHSLAFSQTTYRDTTPAGVFLTIHDRPHIAPLDTLAALCAGADLNMPVPVTDYCGSDSVGSGWKLGGVAVTMPHRVSFSDNGKALVYWAENACGDSTTVGVSLTVHDSPLLEALDLSTRPGVLCAGTVLKEGVNIDAPVIHANGSPIIKKGWLLGGVPVMENGSGYVVTYADRLKDIRYYALNVCSGLVEDTDGNAYTTVVIGSQTWIGGNINDSKKGGVCFQEISANCDTYGRLYTWDEAKVACPAGWHLPSDAEWKTLEMALGMTQADADATAIRNSGGVGTKLKEGGSSGMNLLLGGYERSGIYENLGTLGFYWTSTESGSGAWSRYVHSSQAGVYRSSGIDKASRYSVRCLKD